MKVVILAGGLGTRLAEETQVRPKPMVEIGRHPILWHIMKHYSHYGFNEFYIALGYKGEVIKRYFLNYHMMNSDLQVSIGEHNGVKLFNSGSEDWVVNLIDTGSMTSTGGRIKRLARWLKGETFMVTYGDGVCNVDLQDVLRLHREAGRLATVTAVHPPARFGGLDINSNRVAVFAEKSQIREGWINGGYLVFEPEVLDYIASDDTVLESDVLEVLAAEGQLSAYKHSGFWQCMDTMRDKRYLHEQWQSGDAAWKIW